MKFTVDVRRRGFLVALHAFVRRIKVRLGWRYCANCRQLVKLRWVKDWVIHPEEPPMLYHYECPKCDARSKITPSMLTIKAVHDLGYKDFNDYVEKVIMQNCSE